MATLTPPNEPVAPLAGAGESPATAPHEPTAAEAQAGTVAPAQQEDDIVEVVCTSCYLKM